MKNFGLMGVAGFVAPRHLKAIRDTGNRLVATLDPHDSVGILDQFFPDAYFFTEPERFDRFLEKARLTVPADRIDYLSICTPNYLHDTDIRMALRLGADAICEKPLVINPWNLDILARLEQETGHRAYTVFQLRVHPLLQELKRQLDQNPPSRKASVSLRYVTRRGNWYRTSWKGSAEKSGGLAMNIGIHFFDLLIWLFGGVKNTTVELATEVKMAGELELEHAFVKWFLSVDSADLPDPTGQRGGTAFRSITIDGDEVNFSEGFNDLHTKVYEEILAGRGFGIEDARPSIELVHRIRTSSKS